MKLDSNPENSVRAAQEPLISVFYRERLRFEGRYWGKKLRTNLAMAGPLRNALLIGSRTRVALVAKLQPSNCIPPCDQPATHHPWPTNSAALPAILAPRNFESHVPDRHFRPWPSRHGKAPPAPLSLQLARRFARHTKASTPASRRGSAA